MLSMFLIVSCKKGRFFFDDGRIMLVFFVGGNNMKSVICID